MLEAGQLLEIGRLAVQAALRAGATEAEAYVAAGRSAEMIFTEKVESFRFSASTGLGVRALVGKRLGIASTSLLSPEKAREVAERAVKIARASSEDKEWRSLPSGLKKSRVEGIFDRETAELEPDRLVDCVSQLADAITGLGKPVRPSRGMMRAGYGLVAICNSTGEENWSQGTRASIWVRASAQRAGKSATANESESATSLSGINYAELGLRAAERALDFLEARKVPTGKMDVVLRGDVMASVLATMFAGTLTADAVQEKRSPWADKVGQQVACEAFTLIDDGTHPGGYRSREMDDEGLPTGRTVLIERGVLRGFLYDDYRAKREGKRSTGNAWRAGPGARPSPAPNCLILQPGDWRFEELLADTREGLYVVETIGEWLSDPVRGFLNANVTHGYLIRDGELAQPVSGITIACNFFKAMREDMDAFCRELENYAGFYAPAVRIRGVSISGE